MRRERTYTPKAKSRRRRSVRRLGHSATLESRVADVPLRLSPAKKRRRQTNGWVTPTRASSLLIILVGLWVIYVLFGKSTYYVYGADIQGNMVLDSEEIYQAAGIDSTSIFWVNPYAVQKNIEALDYITSAEVSVKLPATVHITVSERLPQVLWRSGQDLYWVDAEGVFLPAKADAVATGIELQIEDPENSPIDSIDARIIRAAQRIYRYNPSLNHLYYQRELGLVFSNSQGWPVYMGKDDANISAKLQVANALETSLVSKGITAAYLDVRDPMHTFYSTP